jgi:hypothetical protein
MAKVGGLCPKTNVKISCDIRTYGATLLIFKKVSEMSSDLPPVFLRISVGINNHLRKGDKKQINGRYPHTHARYAWYIWVPDLRKGVIAGTIIINTIIAQRNPKSTKISISKEPIE